MTDAPKVCPISEYFARRIMETPTNEIWLSFCRPRRITEFELKVMQKSEEHLIELLRRENEQ